MSAFTGEPRRSDLRLILQALRNGWPVESQRLNEVEGFVIQARLTGRTDRLTSLAAEVLDAIHLHRAGRKPTEQERLPTETTHIQCGAGSGNPVKP